MGESLLTTYPVEEYGLQFCKMCGSTLCTLYQDEVYQITLGGVNGDPDIEIGQHI